MENLKFNGTLVGVDFEKPYEFEGKKGLSNKATVIIGKNIFKIGLKRDLALTLKNVEDKKGALEISISSANLKPVLTLESFVEKK